jgi:ABC-type multidrug transport system permease subunit
MYYRHKAANMYTSFSVIVAFTLAEIPFVLLASLMFTVLFYFPMGFALSASKFFLFFMFITFGIGTFTLIGQMLMSLFKDAQTAQGIGALISSSTSLFSGVFIRPENIPVFWIFMYWLLPGHWIFEGIFMSQFENDETMIVASPGSVFFNALNCTSADANANATCEGSVWFWVQVSFPDWSPSNIPWCALYLIGVMVVTRCISFYGLTTMNHMSN